MHGSMVEAQQSEYYASDFNQYLECTAAYMAMVCTFILDSIIHHLAQFHQARVMETQLWKFLKIALVKYIKAKIEPGAL